jgi:hypothetical protein
MIIERNLHPAGRAWNFVFGLACVIDGLVRVVSLGFLHTTLCLLVTRYQSKAAIEAAIRARGE